MVDSHAFPSTYSLGLEAVGHTELCFHLFHILNLKQFYLTEVFCVASKKAYVSITLKDVTTLLSPAAEWCIVRK